MENAKGKKERFSSFGGKASLHVCVDVEEPKVKVVRDGRAAIQGSWVLGPEKCIDSYVTSYLAAAAPTVRSTRSMSRVYVGMDRCAVTDHGSSHQDVMRNASMDHRG